MPIHPPPGLRQLGDDCFKEVVYEVMEKVFALHNTIGCLFDEAIYKRILARQLSKARLKVPLGLSFQSFHKTLYLDLLVSDGAIFEFKATEGIHEKHRSQLLNYLYALDLPHGKLVNLRGDKVEHEFINAPIPRAERVSFLVNDRAYVGTPGLDHCFKGLVTEILRDWGTCLEVELYEEAVLHCITDPHQQIKPVDIRLGDSIIGSQKLNFLSPDTSFQITAIRRGQDFYEQQLIRFLNHVSLKTIQWVNVGQKLVTFKTITKEKTGL